LTREGINYTDERFRHSDGSSRILALWDQTIETGMGENGNGGRAPEGFNYGTEYTREDIDRALQTDAPFDVVPSRDNNGHGTALAAVAGGSNGSYRGAAPEAEFVIVKLKEAKPYLREFYLVPDETPAYQENDLMLAMAYVERFVRSFERPVVLCIGIGTNQGDHSGESPFAQYLSGVARRRGMAVVICGGNEGNAAHHYLGRLLQGDYGISGIASPMGEAMEIRVSEGCRGFYMELWGQAPDLYTVSVRTPGGEQTPVIYYGYRGSVKYSFVYEKSTVTIGSMLSEGISGEELIYFRFETPTPGIWTVRVNSVQAPTVGIFHAWLPINAFLDVPVSFLKPNPYTTLTEPGMSRNPITVSTYDASNNSFYINSGRGFDRIGGIKPQMAAPGVEVATGRGTMTGSSIAAGLAAGTIAQFMQWAVVEKNIPTIDSRQLTSIFIRGAARERDLTYPNREWGYGRMDIEGCFRILSQT